MSGFRFAGRSCIMEAWKECAGDEAADSILLYPHRGAGRIHRRAAVDEGEQHHKKQRDEQGAVAPVGGDARHVEVPLAKAAHVFDAPLFAGGLIVPPDGGTFELVKRLHDEAASPPDGMRKGGRACARRERPNGYCFIETLYGE